MSQHRCSGCKEDQGNYPRHKHKSGGLLCPRCMRYQSHGGHRGGFGIFSRARDWMSSIWDALREYVTGWFKPDSKKIVKAQARAMHHQQKTLEAKALSIPRDLSSSVPQKLSLSTRK